jgi:hypothetical protein
VNDSWIRVFASVIGRRRDADGKSLDPVKSSAEAKVDHTAIQAASVETEDRDGDFASLGIEITPRFQVRSCVTDPDWTRGGPGLWQNKELGELET